MTLKEKLEIIGNHEDGSDFEYTEFTSSHPSWHITNIDTLRKWSIQEINDRLDFREIVKPKYTLTEDEKIIVRNIDDKWKFIHRTDGEIMFIATCNAKFISENRTWDYEGGHYFNRFPYAEKVFKFIGYGQSVSLDELREIAKENK